MVGFLEQESRAASDILTVHGPDGGLATCAHTVISRTIGVTLGSGWGRLWHHVDRTSVDQTAFIALILNCS